MADIKVTIYADSNGTHLHQIYTGLYLLQQQKKIRLCLRPGTRETKSRPNRQFLAIRIEDKNSSAKCIFDLQDSCKLGLPDSLDWCDVYFKRSLEKNTLIDIDPISAKKIQPFGFNYQVVSSSKAFFMQRIMLEIISRPYNPLAKKNGFHISNIKEYFEAAWKVGSSPLPGPDMLRPGRPNVNGGILFQCRLWDPDQVALHNKEDTHNVNMQRIELIRKLKKEFGKSFTGGIQHNSYAEKIAPELIIDTRSDAKRINYIEMVKQSAIVISTAGLLGSNGWKLGEYIALGKCIVSEPITTKLPGVFEAGQHYASYKTTDSCLEELVILIQDKSRIEKFSNNSTDYYHRFLEPAALMQNHINSALSTI